MNAYLENLDGKLIDCAERYLVHPAQKLFGFNHIHLARLCIILIAIATSTDLLIYGKILGFFFFAPMFFSGQLKELFGSQMLESELARLREGLANPQKTDEFLIWYRVAGSVAVTVIANCVWIDHNYPEAIMSLLIGAYWFLLACDSLPPTESKVRQWINGLQAWGKQPSVVPTSRFVLCDEALF